MLAARTIISPTGGLLDRRRREAARTTAEATAGGAAGRTTAAVEAAPTTAAAFAAAPGATTAATFAATEAAGATAAAAVTAAAATTVAAATAAAAVAATAAAEAAARTTAAAVAATTAAAEAAAFTALAEGPGRTISHGTITHRPVAHRPVGTGRTRPTVAAARAARSTRAAWARAAVLGLTNGDGAPADAVAIHLGDSLLRLIVVGERHETEAAGAAGLAIGDHSCVYHRAERLEGFAQGTLVCGPRKTTDEQLVAHVSTL